MVSLRKIWLPHLTLWTHGHLKKGPFWHWRKLPHLLSGGFLVLPTLSDLPALTLTNTFSSFLHLPHCRHYGQLSVYMAQDKLFTLSKPQSPHLQYENITYLIEVLGRLNNIHWALHS